MEGSSPGDSLKDLEVQTLDPYVGSCSRCITVRWSTDCLFAKPPCFADAEVSLRLLDDTRLNAASARGDQRENW